MDAHFAPVRGLYAWCIYYTEIKPEPVKDEVTFFRAAAAIAGLTQQADTYSAYTLTVFKVLNYLNGKASLPVDAILKWTEMLNPELLSTTVVTITDRTGKERELASQREQYYMWRTRALLEKGRWEECIALCQQALTSVSPLHYDNEVWFGWRIALSHEGNGELLIALDELKALLRRKKEWFIEKEIAELCYKQGNDKEALTYALDSALAYGDVDKKVNLYRLMADILIRLKMEDEAAAHQKLYAMLRSGQADSAKVDDTVREIKQIWQKLRFADRPIYSGNVCTVLPSGKAGFIKADNRQTYYFQFKDFKGRREFLSVGLPVTFFVEKGYDKKKDKEAEIAVNVKPQST
jgi:tetratricopeptide (TPR) repeat protein